MEANLAQHLDGLLHEPLFQVLLDFCKSYDSLDRGRYLEILRGYGMGPNLARLIKNYWKCQRVFSKAGNFLGTEFGTGRGVTQGDPASPMIFNIVVDEVVQEVLDLFCSLHEAQHGIVWDAWYRNLVFYTDDVRIAVRYHEWVQDVLTVTVAMFHRMGLDANLKKTNAMVCTPRFVRWEWEEKAYKKWATGKGENFWERKKRSVSSTKCSVTVAFS